MRIVIAVITILFLLSLGAFVGLNFSAATAPAVSDMPAPATSAATAPAEPPWHGEMVALRASLAAKEDRLRALEDRLSVVEAELAERSTGAHDASALGATVAKGMQQRIAKLMRKHQDFTQMHGRKRMIKWDTRQYQELFDALNLPKEDQAQFRRHVMRDDQDALRELLGDKGYRYYRDYEARLEAEALVEHLTKRLEQQHVDPLTEEQQQRLLAVLHEARKRQEEQPGGAAIHDDDGFFVDQLGEKPPEDEATKRILAQAKDILAPGQVAELEQVLSRLNAVPWPVGTTTATHQTFTFGTGNTQGTVTIQVTGDGEDAIQIQPAMIQLQAADAGEGAEKPDAPAVDAGAPADEQPGN